MSAETRIINRANETGDTSLAALYQAERGMRPAISIEADHHTCRISWLYCDFNRLILALETSLPEASRRWYLDAYLETGTASVQLKQQYGISDANQHLITCRMPDFTDTAEMNVSGWQLSLHSHVETEKHETLSATITVPLVVDTTRQTLHSRTPDFKNDAAEIYLERASITPSQMRFYLQHRITEYPSDSEWLSVGHVTAGQMTNQAGMQQYLPDRGLEELVFNQSAGQTETIQLVIKELVPAKSTKRKYPAAQRLHGPWIFSLTLT